MAGLSLTGAFAGAQLRAPAPAARVSHTSFSVVAVRAFRRSHLSRRETAESRPPTPVARAAARRATAANALGGARAFYDGVRHRVECL